jgi:competence ComEA-like helix-hairpin-helix protein
MTLRGIAIVLLLVNLNTATVRQRQGLPGIGPSLAKKIVEFRSKEGGFRRVEELLAVPGISEKRWQVLKDLVCVETCEFLDHQAGDQHRHLNLGEFCSGDDCS